MSQQSSVVATHHWGSSETADPQGCPSCRWHGQKLSLFQQPWIRSLKVKKSISLNIEKNIWLQIILHILPLQTILKTVRMSLHLLAWQWTSRVNSNPIQNDLTKFHMLSLFSQAHANQLQPKCSKITPTVWKGNSRHSFTFLPWVLALWLAEQSLQGQISKKQCKYFPQLVCTTSTGLKVWLHYCSFFLKQTGSINCIRIGYIQQRRV